MQGERPVFCRIEPIVAGYRVNVAIEHETDDAALRIDQGAAGISANYIAVRGYAKGRAQVEIGFHLHPAIRDLERRYSGCPLECAVEIGERLYGDAVFNPSLYGAVVQAQREGGVGIDVGSICSEALRGNPLRGR